MRKGEMTLRDTTVALRKHITGKIQNLLLTIKSTVAEAAKNDVVKNSVFLTKLHTAAMWVLNQAHALNNLILREGIIAGLKDEKLGEKAVLVFEGVQDDSIAFKDIFSKAHLTKYEIPKDVFFLTQFPETGNGKILRNEIIHELIEFDK